MSILQRASDLASHSLWCESDRDFPMQFAGEVALKQAHAETSVSGWRHRRTAPLVPRQVQLLGRGAPANSYAAFRSGKGAMFGGVGGEFMQGETERQGPLG